MRCRKANLPSTARATVPTYEGLGATFARFDQLAPDTEYFLRVTWPDGQLVDLEGLDFCFRVGPGGVRGARPAVQRQRPLTAALAPQAARRRWVDANRDGIDTLFLASSVVFSHGEPPLGKFAVKNWGWVLLFAAWLVKSWTKFNPWADDFQTNVGDLRDDLNDSWGRPSTSSRPTRCSTSCSAFKTRRRGSGRSTS